MGTFKALFGRKSTPDDTVEELKVLLSKLEEDKAGLESLVSSATEASAALRSQVESLSQPDNPIVDLRNQADVIRGEFAGYTSDIAAARKDLGALRQAQEDVLSRFGEARKQLTGLKDEIDGAAGRVAKLENSLEMLSAAEETAARTEQHIKALNALSDYVTQKVAALEKQREVVDRAAAQGARLHELVWELDARLKKQQEESRALRRAQASVEELKTLHKDVEKRTAEVRATHDGVRKDTEAIQTGLVELREEIRHGMQRFELDKGGLEAVSQRIGDLRSLLVEAENRFQALEQSTQQIADARAQADNLSVRLTAVTGEVAAVEEQLERDPAVRQTVDRGQQSADELAAAEEHSAKVSQIAEQLESRAGHLRFADKRMTRFEEKLAELERLEQEVLRSIEALGARQASVNSVRKDLKKLFDVAEQTREGVRSITAARDEVQAARAKTEEVLAAAKGVMAIGELIEEREQQLHAAEARLARAEGVLMDTQASLETLRSQKALIDHVVEKAGKLEFQAKEAEAMIASLREERELAAKIHEAVVELRNEGGKKAG
jgi:chromosome segregation ATPase